MAKEPEAADPWNTLLMAAVGGMVGVALSTIVYLLHDHTDLSADEALWHHFIPEMLTAMAGGAIVFGGVSALRNGLKRHR